MKRFWWMRNYEPLARVVLSIEGEGDGGNGEGGGGSESTLSSAERALEFWESDENGGGVNQRTENGDGNNAGEQGKDGAAANAAGDEAGAGEDKENKDGQIPDEQLQADPRFKELNAFREEVQPVWDKYGIPDAKELDLQLADSKVLYDIMQGKGSPSQLLDVMTTSAGWTKDQVSGVAQDLIGWLTKQGFLKDGQAQNVGQTRGTDGKFKDPLEEKVENITKTLDQQKTEREQAQQRERQGKIFDSFTKKVGELMEAKGIDKEDLHYYGREIRALIPPAQFDAVINRIEKGNFVDVQKFFDQIHTREAARLKRYSDKQVNNATRREKTTPRSPAGGNQPTPAAGQQKRNLQNRDDRLAAATAEWDK